MKNFARYVKDKLMESIKSLESLKGMYVRHADKDFKSSSLGDILPLPSA